MSFTIKQKLDLIKDDAAATLPTILATAGLSDFDTYLAEPPNDEEKNQFCVYPDITRSNDTERDFDIICQLQLATKTARESYDYQDIVNNYFIEFDPETIGKQIRGEILSENFPPEEHSGAIIIFTVEFQDDIDDCNYADDA